MAPTRRSGRNTSSFADTSHPYQRTKANVIRTQTPISFSPSPSARTASIARPQGSNSLRLTVKAEPSKLRQATSGVNLPPNPYAETSESDATPAPAPTRPTRASRNPRTVVEADTDEDEDEDEEMVDADGDEEEEEDEEDEEDEGEDEEDEDEEDATRDDVDDELLANEDSEQDAEGSEEESSTDPLSNPPPRPIISQRKGTTKGGKPSVTITAALPREGPLKSVEAKEMAGDDDDELSELESEDDLGQDDELGGGGEDEGDEEDDDNSDSDIDGSRSATPDLSKLTRRQRGHFEEDDGSLMALSNEAQKKKHLTAEEHAMRRAEMARRRKNLSEKRNEEEKMDTINKLLKKPAPKRKTRAEILAAQQADAIAASSGTPGAEGEDAEELLANWTKRPDPVYVRWVQSRQGSRLEVNEEWLDAPIGAAMAVGWKGKGKGDDGNIAEARVLVEEVA